jgi:hypothetical protein
VLGARGQVLTDRRTGLPAQKESLASFETRETRLLLNAAIVDDGVCVAID